MRIVADESVDQPMVEMLRTDGHSVDAVAEMSPGVTDDEVLSMAVASGAVLLTADKDFGELVFRQGRASTGVVLIRLSGSSPGVKAELVRKAVADHGNELAGAFAVIGHTQVRIRGPITLE